MIDPRVMTLLKSWATQYARGREITAEELCRDCPELIPEVARRLPSVREQVKAKLAAKQPAAPPATAEHTPAQPCPPVVRHNETPHPAAAETSEGRPPTDAEIGRTIPRRLGVYEVKRVLGQGGMGAVLLAVDPALGREVAVKLMKPEIAARKEARDRFIREARTTAMIEHENVISIFSVGEEAGLPYLVMPLLRGESLEDRLKRDGRLPVAEVCRIGREMAAGLWAAHEQGLIHRDIKPGNVWLEGGRGRVKILDFGLARPQESDENLTRTGFVVGTPAYMAPEQARGNQVDYRADLFSLGVVMYQMATGRRPFTGSNVMAILTSLATENPAPPQSLNPEVPPELSILILRLLAKAPDHRPQRGDEVVTVIEAVETARATGQPVAIQQPTVGVPPPAAYAPSPTPMQFPTHTPMPTPEMAFAFDDSSKIVGPPSMKVRGSGVLRAMEGGEVEGLARKKGGGVPMAVLVAAAVVLAVALVAGAYVVMTKGSKPTTPAAPPAAPAAKPVPVKPAPAEKPADDGGEAK